MPKDHSLHLIQKKNIFLSLTLHIFTVIYIYTYEIYRTTNFAAKRIDVYQDKFLRVNGKAIRLDFHPDEQ